MHYLQLNKQIFVGINYLDKNLGQHYKQ